MYLKLILTCTYLFEEKVVSKERFPFISKSFQETEAEIAFIISKPSTQPSDGRAFTYKLYKCDTIIMILSHLHLQLTRKTWECHSLGVSVHTKLQS